MVLLIVLVGSVLSIIWVLNICLSFRFPCLLFGLGGCDCGGLAGFCLLRCGLLHCFGLQFVSLIVSYCLWFDE